MKSTMSSSADARSRMSSRSIGVTNVWLRRWTMSCVIRSPSCSQITMSRASSPWSGQRSSMRSRISPDCTMLRPASSNRSKNSRSRGAKSRESPAMAGQSSCERGAKAALDVRLLLEHGLEALHLLRGHAVGVLRTGEGAGPHVLGVGPHGVDHRLAHLRVALDELRLEGVVDAEQVVVDEDLAVRARAGADADHGDLHVVHDQVGQL